ncbi:MAG: hypothetical protein P8M73_09910, partial [Luminiphilus sp.]|nr:hypothetical protein [Luminiphilus sp.]
MAKYVARKGNQLWYQRAWPTRVRAFAGSAKYRTALGLDINAPDHAVQKAAAIAQEAFELECKRFDNSDVTTSVEGVIDKLADRAMKDLRKRDREHDPVEMPVAFISDELSDRMDAGEEIDIPKELGISEDRGTPILVKASGVEGGVENVTPEQIAKLASQVARPLIEYAISEMPEQTQLEKQVKARVRERLSKRVSNSPKHLSQLWAPYCRFRGHERDEKNSRYRKKLRNWNRALAAIGNHPISHGIDKEINRGVREVYNEDLDRGVQTKSAVRNLSEAIGCFRWAADEYDLDWNIKGLRQQRQKTVERVVATVDDQIKLAKACTEWDDVQGVIGLLAMHGMIPSEIANIESTSSLEGKIRHIVVPTGKTKDRRRVVTLAFGTDTIWLNIDQAIAYCRDRADPGATFNKRLGKLFTEREDLVLYSFRHAARNAFVMANINTGIM